MAEPKKILLTTSREPTAKIRTFCNDLAQVIPDVVRVNRGKMSTDEIAEKALELDAKKVVTVNRGHAGSGTIKFFKVDESGLVSIPPIIHANSIMLTRELGACRGKPAVSLVTSPSETSKETSRLADALSEFFSIPIMTMDEALKTVSTQMRLLRDKRDRITITFTVKPKNIEVGPQITVSSVEW